VSEEVGEVQPPVLVLGPDEHAVAVCAQKAKIFLALLGKQCGVTPPGWREAAEEYGEDGARRSVADITGPASLAEVRATKQAAKQAAKEARTGNG
jgi:uncharacterized HhH-GPD family protein